MALHWCAAGMVEAGKQFRRVNGYLHLPASAPRPGKPGPGRPSASTNRRPAPHYEVGKTVKRDLTLPARQKRAGYDSCSERTFVAAATSGSGPGSWPTWDASRGMPMSA